jgi:large subunit ribosomal protein L19e
MKLDTKKKLAASTLKVGLGRVVFDNNRLDEIKEAITKQDIRDLKVSGAISIRETTGKKKIVKRKTRRRGGKVKKKVGTRKQDYVKLTRKLRGYLKELKKQGRVNGDTVKEARKKIRNKEYKSKRNLKENLKL